MPPYDFRWNGEREEPVPQEDAASLDTNSNRRDADLRSDNFFHVERELLAEAGERDTAIGQYRIALDLEPLRADAAERIRYLTDSRQRALLVAGPT